MAIHLRENRYKGVNAHLHSCFQSKGRWSSFHTNHIADLAKAINAKLPPGYLVDIEQSLQIREYHPDTGERIRHPELDITVYSTSPSSRRETASSPGGVDDPIPAIDIPLLGSETISVDFGAVYHDTFRSLSAYRQRVDYEQLPERFETYSEADQGRIRAVMEAVKQARPT